jgi:hypothetical protein
MGDKNQRSGEPDYGRSFGTKLSDLEMNARQHFVTPANDGIQTGDRRTRFQDMPEAGRAGQPDGVPYYYNQYYTGMPVPYDGPSEQKENLLLRSAVRDAADREIMERKASGQDASGVIRTDPITDEEVAYLKSMKDQTKLAKFDDYVESFIDPRQPGNMEQLMKLYPEYVSRRLQQAHTDYEFALRNQMIDMWGINTFDDLHFKYLVDQGEITGPKLVNGRPPMDDTFSPGVLSIFNFQSPGMGDSDLRLPFASAITGHKPANPNNWTINRENRPLGNGNTPQELARGMYGTRTPLGALGSAGRLPIGTRRGNRGDGFFAGGGFFQNPGPPNVGLNQAR